MTRHDLLELLGELRGIGQDEGSASILTRPSSYAALDRRASEITAAVAAALAPFPPGEPGSGLTPHSVRYLRKMAEDRREHCRGHSLAERSVVVGVPWYALLGLVQRYEATTEQTEEVPKCVTT